MQPEAPEQAKEDWWLDSTFDLRYQYHSLLNLKRQRSYSLDPKLSYHFSNFKWQNIGVGEISGKMAVLMPTESDIPFFDLGAKQCEESALRASSFLWYHPALRDTLSIGTKGYARLQYLYCCI